MAPSVLCEPFVQFFGNHLLDIAAGQRSFGSFRCIILIHTFFEHPTYEFGKRMPAFVGDFLQLRPEFDGTTDNELRLLVFYYHTSLFV